MDRSFKRGRGIVSTVVNKAIDLLPIELHLPGYRFCGPGTKLRERLSRNDVGINQLDEACKLHDIAYSTYTDSVRRTQADKQLAERAWQRFKASDSSVGEKAAAWAVTTAMKVKTKIGGGKKRKRRGTIRKKVGKGVYLKPWSGKGRKSGGGSKRRKKTCCRRKKKLPIDPDKTTNKLRTFTLRKSFEDFEI